MVNSYNPLDYVVPRLTTIVDNKANFFVSVPFEQDMSSEDIGPTGSLIFVCRPNALLIDDDLWPTAEQAYQ